MKLLHSIPLSGVLLLTCATWAQTPYFVVKPTATPTPARSSSPANRKSLPAPNKQHIADSSWISRDPELPDQDTVAEVQAQQLYAKAWQLIKQRKYEDALAPLREAQKLVPKEPAIPVMIGIAQAMLKKMDDAIASFRAAVTLNSAYAVGHYDLCVALDTIDHKMEAVEECREAVRLAPKRNSFRNYLARLYMLSDRLDDAIALMQAAAEQYPNDVVAQGTLGDIYFLAAEYEQAASIYEKIARQWPDKSQVYLRLSDVYDYLERPADSIAAAKKFAELEPKLALASLNLGQKYQTFGFVDEAIAAYDQAITLDKNCGPAYLGLSEMYDIAGDRDKTLANLRLAYKLLPKSVPMAYKVGDAMLLNDEADAAIELLEYANSNRPDTPDIMRALGLAYIESDGPHQDYEKGAELIARANQIAPLPPNMKMSFNPKERTDLLERFESLQAAVKVNPNDIRSRLQLARAYMYKGLYKEEEEQFLEVIKLSPIYQNYNGLAIFYQGRREYEKALAAIDKAIELNPHHVLLITKSGILEKLGRLDDAIAAARRAVEIKGDSIECRFDLAELLVKKGDRPGAVQQYQAAFELASGDVRTNSRLAWLYVRMGNKDGAFRHYLILKSIAPGQWQYLETGLRAHFGALPN